MNQLDILKSGIVGAKIVDIKKEKYDLYIVLNNGNTLRLIPILDRCTDKLQAVIKEGIIW